MHKTTFFLTWTTYGTWLPGDERGWHHHNKGEQLANSRLKQWCSNQMRTGEVVLALFDRVIVEDACRAHCVYRNWHLHAVNARSNHVHAIVTADTTGKKLLNELKLTALDGCDNTHPVGSKGEYGHAEVTLTLSMMTMN